MSRAFAAIYDLVMGAAERGPLQRWRRALAEPMTGRVIEIAAGTGLDFPYYPEGAIVVATEPDPAMLARSRARARRARASILLVAADAQALPFRARSFDGAVVGLALCTIPSPPAALAELRRVLRPTGVVRLLEHVRMHGVIGWLQDRATPLWRRVAGGCRLNEPTVQTILDGGFQIDDLRWHLGGYVVAIEASLPERHGEGVRDLSGFT